jgi:hypothetical protein
MALKHAVNIRNSLPRCSDRKSPISIFSSTSIEPNLKNFHPFGCPVYVLNEPLQTAGAIYPRWDDRSRVGIHLCHSPNHASNVSLVLNTQTGHVSPQFHCVFDDNFDTVTRDKKFQSLWQQKANLQSGSSTDPESSDSLPTAPSSSSEPAATNMATDLLEYKAQTIPPHLCTPWDGSNVASSESNPSEGAGITSNNEQPSAREPDSQTPNVATDSNRQDGSINASEGATTTDSPVPPTRNASKQPQTRQTQADSIAVNEDSSRFGHPTVTRSGRQVKPARIRAAFPANYADNLLETLTDEDGVLTDEHPLAMVVSWTRSFVANRSDPDTMTFEQAMRQPDREKFIEAMVKELDDHTNNGHWEIVHHSAAKNNKPILAVWSMKRKRDPAGEIIKWKARLCAHGGMQTHGINYWDTYSPVVSWSTVRLILILAVILGWHMRSLDFVLAYPQADVRTDIFMRIPKGCSIPHLDRNKHLLKLCKNLYGLKDAGLTWHEHIKKGLINRGFKPSDIDPCLFTKASTILVLYVDDAVLFGPSKSEIDDIVKSLKADFNLTDDGDLRDYLGVRIEKKDGKIQLVQPRMIKRILELLNLAGDTPTKMHDTPANADTRTLSKNDPEPRKLKWNYRAVIGALEYLQGMTRPDLTYATHQCARFSNDPRQSHEIAVKRIGRYLKRTPTQGLILEPDMGKGFECYVDADWAGNWDKRFATDPSSVFSRTGYVILYAGCPIIWASKMQSVVALSTTEAEYIALSTALREVICMMNLLKELKQRGIPIPFTKPKVTCRVFEDNAACIELAKEPKLRPRTKHLAVRLHHFRDYVQRGEIDIHHINTKHQIADIFTKNLPVVQFRNLRHSLMKW